MNIKTKGNKLRIYIYGKTALNDINYLNKKLYVNLEQAKNNVYKVNDNQSNTEYLIIPGEINAEKNNIIYDYLMKNYQDENLIKANDIINEKIKKQSNDLFNESLETNEFFDKRNLYAFKFPTNDEELEIVNNYLYECKNYYHETGNGDGDKLIEIFFELFHILKVIFSS